ncbi:MAG: hypothetical protein R3B06_02570 [Kofleriaceae bacterium]
MTARDLSPADPRTPDEALLAAYAEAPAMLTAAERATVEAWLGAAPTDAPLVAEVRALPGAGAPDWAKLEAAILDATTRARRRRWPWLVGGATLAAAAAVLLLVAPRATVPLEWPAALVVAPAPPAPVALTPIDLDDEPAEGGLPDDLGGLGAADAALLDELAQLDDADLRLDDDLPAVGATWTGWLDTLTDAELERALAWLDEKDAT